MLARRKAAEDLLEHVDNHNIMEFIKETHFYRTSICEGGLGSRNSVCPSVHLSVRPSVTRVNCDKTK